MLTELPVASKPIRERGEQLVRDSSVQWTILRPTMIYGTPADRNIARLVRFVSRWPVVPIVAPDALQQPVHVEDVATAVATALACPITIGPLPMMRTVEGRYGCAPASRPPLGLGVVMNFPAIAR